MNKVRRYLSGFASLSPASKHQAQLLGLAEANLKGGGRGHVRDLHTVDEQLDVDENVVAMAVSGIGQWFGTGLLVVTDKRLIHVRGGVLSTPKVVTVNFAEIDGIKFELESPLNTPVVLVALGSPTHTTIKFSLFKKDTYSRKSLRLALQSMFDGAILDELPGGKDDPTRRPPLP